MTARVDALLDQRRDVLKMPLAGLFQERGAQVAYVRGAAGKAKQVLVQPGLRTEIDVEILGGLADKDQVLTEKPVDFAALPADVLEKAAQSRRRKAGSKARGQREKRRGRRSKGGARRAMRGF